MAEAVNWAPVYEDARNSMFFVMLTPSKTNAHVQELKDLAIAANTIDKGKERDDLLAATKVSTGFVVGMAAGDIGILTTAHSIEHLFRASRGIRPSQINRLFTVRVLCGHYENAYRAAGNLNALRAYGIGRVAWIDCEHDLMLVAVAPSEVRSFGAGGLLPCPVPHPALLACGGQLDPPTNQALMVSWPPYRPDLMSIGRIGARRTVNQISQPNRFEYAIDIVEVQMASGQGSSGAPLLNQRGEVIGVMHGLHETDRSHSYFIAVNHVRDFLGMFGVAHAPVVPPVVPAPVVP